MSLENWLRDYTLTAMAIHLHRSHRMERLVERLLAQLHVSEASVFEAPWVVVQGKGLERWLAQRGALAEGVYAGIRSLHVRQFVDEACAAILDVPGAVIAPDSAEAGASQLSRDTADLVFPVLRELDGLLAEPEGEELRRYLEVEDDHERRAQLAERLASVLDGYVVHRPDLLEAWERGVVSGVATERAQAALYRRLLQGGLEHEATRVRRVMERVSQLVAPPAGLPRSVHFFGVGSLAPLHLELLRVLGQLIDVHLFVLAPTEAWLGDLDTSERARGEVGALVSAFGKLAMEFQQLLEAIEVDEREIEEAVPNPATVLHVLQHDLLKLTMRGDGEGRLPRVAVAQDDRSFVVHACHSERRELEVLHAELVECFERDRTLQPEDVAVLAADIDRYAPLVHAVFGRTDDATRRIPYHVADRGPRETSDFVDALFAILSCANERVTLPRVADLLERELVRAKFSLGAEDAARFVAYLSHAGARYGLDAADRERDGQPPLVEHTFERGLDRIALGFATGDDASVFEDVVPAEGISASEAETLRAGFAFFDAFVALRTKVVHAATVPELVAFTEAAMDTLLTEEGSAADETRAVRKALATIEARASAARFDGRLSRAAFDRMLLAALERDTGSGGFLGGGVTFCRHVPMRAIPFRVICLLGLDDAKFPRNADPVAFDLAAREPRRGDRTPRDDDRQAFLDALCSARDALHMFYVGFDVADGRERPVSTVVERTLEVVERAVVVADGRGVRTFLRVDHPLHRFDPEVFTAAGHERGLRSRELSDWAAARAAIGASSIPRLDLSLVSHDPPPTNVEFDDLTRWLLDPARDFLTRVLRAAASEAPEMLEERESLESDGLALHAIRRLTLDRIAAGATDEEVLAELRGRSVLPPGVAGTHEVEDAIAFARELVATLPLDSPRSPHRFDLRLGELDLRGVLRDLHDDGQRIRDVSKVDWRRRFRVHVRHLALCAVSPSGVALMTTLAGRSTVGDSGGVGTHREEALDRALATRRLGVLCDGFRAARNEPVWVTSPALEAYAKARGDGASIDASLSRAARAVVSSLRRSSSFDGPIAGAEVALLGDVVRQSSNAVDARLLGASFQEIAEEVYLPFVAAAKAGAT